MLNIDAAAAAREVAALRLASAKTSYAERTDNAAQARFDDRVEEGQRVAATRTRPQDQPVPMAQRLVDIRA